MYNFTGKELRWWLMGDVKDYLHQASISIYSWEFFVPTQTDSFYPRPFTVPLIYKIASSQPNRIFLLQNLIYSFSFFVFIHSIMQWTKVKWIQLVTIVAFYLLALWHPLSGWNWLILSESLSLSFMFLWFGTHFLYLRNQNWSMLTLHILVTILFSFTRDSWPYIILMYYVTVLLLYLVKTRHFYIKDFILVLFSTVLFVFQSWTNTVGRRSELPLLNNLVLRILPSEKYTSWFVEHDMPQAQLLKKEYGELKHWNEIYQLYKDDRFLKLRDWAVSHGKSSYTKFLFTHPDYLFLKNESEKDLKRIFSVYKNEWHRERFLPYNYGFIRGPYTSSKVSSIIFPLFTIYSSLCISLGLVILSIKRKEIEFLMPSVLFICFSVNGWLLYLADTLEIERHVYISQFAPQIIGLLALVLSIELIHSWYRKTSFYNNKDL